MFLVFTKRMLRQVDLVYNKLDEAWDLYTHSIL